MSELELKTERLDGRVTALEVPPMQGEHEVGGARIGAQFIGVDAINSVQSDDADSVLASNGAIKNDGTITHRVLAHLETPTSIISMFRWLWSSVPRATVDVPTGAGMPATSLLDVVISPVLVDWDPAAVTFNTRPTIFGDVETVRHQAGDTGTLEAASNSDYTQDVVENPNAFWGLSSYVISVADAAAGRMIHGFDISLAASFGALSFDIVGVVRTTFTTTSLGVTIPTQYAGFY